MVDFALRGVRVLNRITKDKGDGSLPLLAFQRDVVNTIFRNIKRKADYPRAMLEFDISHQMFVVMTQNISRCNLNAGVFRIPSNT